MRKLIIHILFFFTIFNFIFYNNGFSQEAIVVHNKVGVLIDSLENFKYLIFTDYSFDEFIAAQVFKNFDGNHKLVIYLKNEETIDRVINKEYIKQLADKINVTENNYFKQDTINQYSVFFNDGSILIGSIKSFTNENVKLISENTGLISILTKNIIIINKKDSLKTKKSTLIENPHYSRYFYAPSAIPIEKGEGYFQDIYLLFLSANYSVTNHAVIGAGFSIIPGMDIGQQAFFVNAKVAYRITNKFYLGGGGLYFGFGEMGGNIGIGYTVGTYGTQNHNATLGIGYGFSGDKLMETPVFTLCGMTRLSKRISLMSENWFGTVSYEECISPDCIEYETVREFHCLVSYGLRFFSENISVDIAFLNVPTSEEMYFPGIPYIDFVVRF
ncbi:MAG: hypothetical protein A2W99_08110 [Bacteroidetes bacterium GWF2_33_16]|nr:MAG: hypothetical protein A2X00_08455 [Bacteroidetes bacterium GWE2_32_14]OFY02252.1 MAG: hypothetical protein A2W99_08110 [Bacteroidetes bacterium GWF2_33_16]